MRALIKKFREHAFFIITSAIVIAAYFVIFGAYFPNANGGLGHDYEQQLPNLLTGYYWFQNNGLFSIPWFSPAQCGGVPFYADPGHGLYALPQLIVPFFNPVLAVKLTFFIFALAGYFGFYFLLKRRFNADARLAVLGATLFLFNGFYAYRMIIGHPFHAFMLLPLLAFLLIAEPAPPGMPPPRKFFSKKNIFVSALAGAIIAYMFHSAMMHIIPPVILAVVVILLIHAYLCGGRKEVWLRFGAACIMALGLASSKLIASLSFLAYFPRDYYSLPGFPKIAEALEIAFKSLFFRPPLEQAMKSIANNQWAFGQHELEFGITPLPLIIILAAAVFYLYRLIRKQTKPAMPSKRAMVYFTAIALLLFIPIALNFYAPAWNKFLKILPLIKSSSLLLRWFAAYIPIFILAGILVINSWQKTRKYAAWIAAASIVFVIGYQFSENRAYYDAQTYNGEVINRAYARAKSSHAAMPIRGVSIYDPDERPDPARGQNDMMVVGFSQIACYNAIFGYRLEKLPIGDMRPGLVFETAGKHFNIKNPACYVFPKENNCVSGDHFRIDQHADAEKFLQYKPYPFAKSPLQKLADVINVIFLFLFTLVLIYPAVLSVRKRLAK